MNIKSKQVLPYVAAAVAASCGVASAATLGVTPFKFGSEALAVQVAAVPSYSVGLPVMQFTIGSDAYRTGDTIELTVTGGTVLSASKSFACETALADGTGVSGTMQFSYTSVSGNVVTYTVANRDASKVAYVSANTALICSMGSSGILITGSSLAAGTTTTVNYQPRGAGVTYDGLTTTPATTGVAAAGAVPVAYTLQQYSIPSGTIRNPTTNAVDGSVTQNDGSKTISTRLTDWGTGTAGSTATLSWVFRDDSQAGGFLNGGQLLQTSSAIPTATLTGDFSFLDDNVNGCTTADLSLGAGRASATGGTLTINSACTVLTITGSASPSSRDTTTSVKFFVNGMDDNLDGANLNKVPGRTIAVSSNTGSVSLSDGTSTGITKTYRTLSFAPGAWSATAGSSQSGINIPYLPYGTGISRIVYLTNQGSASAVVTISGKGETGTVCSSTNFATVTVPAGGVGLLTTAIDAGISTCLGASYAGKVQIDLSVSGSAANEVTSAYNVNGNRVNVINNTN